MSGEARSDERIREEIRKRLTHAAHVDSHDVSVQVTAGVVRLDGSVPELRMREYVVAIVEAASGLRGIENRLRVANEAEDWPKERWMGVQNAGAQTGAKVPPGEGDAEAGAGS
jgi:hypothetical protein